jgi:hypothetical protein
MPIDPRQRIAVADHAAYNILVLSIQLAVLVSSEEYIEFCAASACFFKMCIGVSDEPVAVLALSALRL